MRKVVFAELSQSFATQGETEAFAEFLKSHGVVESLSIGRLVTHTGIVTDWYRLSIPAKCLKRAEDLRAAWKAGRASVE